jgi:hypothetical protein
MFLKRSHHHSHTLFLQDRAPQVEALASLGWGREDTAEVARLIRMTAGHAVEPGDGAGEPTANAFSSCLA